MSATVGVTAGRRAEEQATLLERAGLRVLIGPAMGTAMVTESGPLRDITTALIARPPDYVVADTGIGIRSWLAAAAGWGCEAEAWGLVNRVVADDRVDDEAGALASTLAAGPTATLGVAKRLVIDGASSALGAALNRETIAISAAADSADGREGIAAFVEKRPARFGR